MSRREQDLAFVVATKDRPDDLRTMLASVPLTKAAEDVCHWLCQCLRGELAFHR